MGQEAAELELDSQLEQQASAAATPAAAMQLPTLLVSTPPPSADAAPSCKGAGTAPPRARLAQLAASSVLCSDEPPSPVLSPTALSPVLSPLLPGALSSQQNASGSCKRPTRAVPRGAHRVVPASAPAATEEDAEAPLMERWAHEGEIACSQQQAPWSDAQPGGLGPAERAAQRREEQE
eukprot:gene561-665_t